jgi:DNA-binding MarR family transcriptional regulator
MTFQEQIKSCLCLNLRKAAGSLTTAFNATMAESGLLVTQLPIVVALEYAGNLPLTLMSRVLNMDRTTLSRNVNPLIKSGFVAQAVGKDRRQRVLSLTDDGRKALHLALPLWRQAQSEWTSRLGQETVDSILLQTQRIAEA